jgi:hypothetical protein
LLGSIGVVKILLACRTHGGSNRVARFIGQLRLHKYSDADETPQTATASAPQPLIIAAAVLQRCLLGEFTASRLDDRTLVPMKLAAASDHHLRPQPAPSQGRRFKNASTPSL